MRWPSRLAITIKSSLAAKKNGWSFLSLFSACIKQRACCTQLHAIVIWMEKKDPENIRIRHLSVLYWMERIIVCVCVCGVCVNERTSRWWLLAYCTLHVRFWAEREKNQLSFLTPNRHNHQDPPINFLLASLLIAQYKSNVSGRICVGKGAKLVAILVAWLQGDTCGCVMTNPQPPRSVSRAVIQRFHGARHSFQPAWFIIPIILWCQPLLDLREKTRGTNNLCFFLPSFIFPHKIMQWMGTRFT